MKRFVGYLIRYSTYQFCQLDNVDRASWNFKGRVLDFTSTDKDRLLSDNALLLPLLVGAVSIESSCTPSK